MLGCACYGRGSSTRISTHGHLRDLVTCRVGLSLTADGMGGKSDDKTIKKKMNDKNWLLLSMIQA